MHHVTLQLVRRLLHYSAEEAARWIPADEAAGRPDGVEVRTWHRWEAGRMAIPENVAQRIEQLVQWRQLAIDNLQAQVNLAAPAARLWLRTYEAPEDWPGEPMLWRPAQAASAAVLAQLWPRDVAPLLGAAAGQVEEGGVLLRPLVNWR
jgi:Domain of unknown function (DUF1870)